VKCQQTLIWYFDLTSQEVNNLIFLTVRLKSNVSLEGILKSGPCCNFCDENGDTPLIWAVRNGNKEIIKLLLDYGADPYLKNKQGLNAICYAAKKPEILTLFEERYLMLNALGNIIFVMYEQAMQEGNDNLAKTLLDIAVELKHEGAMRIMDTYKKMNNQNDYSLGVNTHAFFNSISNNESQQYSTGTLSLNPV
jgi:hypothetical protein